jgi:hypothetical protein
MLKWLRRQRLIAALLITANPALIGSWAAAYHPCPVRDGAVVAAQVVVDEHAGHHEMAPTESAPAPSHGHGDEAATCSCIGQCLTAGIALPSDAGRESQVASLTTERVVRIPQSALASPASAQLHRLPPSTAPPIA